LKHSFLKTDFEIDNAHRAPLFALDRAFYNRDACVRKDAI